LKTDIAAVKGNGARVLLSIGGANDGGIVMQTPVQVDEMVASVLAICNQYNLDGVDWDLENGGAGTNLTSLISASTKLKTAKGKDFIITAAVQPGVAMYEQLAVAKPAVLDIYGPMFYEDNLSVSARQAQIVANAKIMVSLGLPASRYAIGTMYANSQYGPFGQMSPADYKVAQSTLATQNINVRGAFVWDMTVESQNNYVFATTFSGTPPVTPPPVTPPVTVGKDPWRANKTLVWNKKLPATTPVNPFNANYVSRIVGFLRSPGPYNIQESIHPNVEAYAGPFYVATAADPIQLVSYGGGWDAAGTPGGIRIVNTGDDAGRYNALNGASGLNGVRIPVGAKASTGTDHEMCIYDSVTDILYEFWSVLEPHQTTDFASGGPTTQTNPTGRYQVMTAGVMPNFTKTSTGRMIDTPAYMLPNGVGGLWGTCATGLSQTGGRVTVQDMIDGVIPHAIDVALPGNLKNKDYSYPAWRSDWGDLPIEQGPPEGLRFRLPLGIDLSMVTNPFALMVAKALQDYGAIINDLSGKVSMRFDNTIGFTSVGKPNPWPALFQQRGIDFGTSDYYRNQANVRAVLAQIPWERLQFLPMDYGKAGELG
jgi:hypothetical protein